MMVCRSLAGNLDSREDYPTIGGNTLVDAIPGSADAQRAHNNARALAGINWTGWFYD